MAAPSKRPTPAAQLRERLAMAQKAGIPFDLAWEKAFGRLFWPHDTQHRRSWKKALGSTREAWRSAYDREGENRYDLAA